MLKDFAILLGVPAVVYFLVNLTGKPRAASIAGGLTLLGLLAIFVPNFITARERIEHVRSAFLEFREGVVAGSPDALNLLIQHDREVLEQASRELGGKIPPEQLLSFAGPHPLSNETITVAFPGPDRAIVRIIGRGEGTMGLVEGDKMVEYESALEEGQWKFGIPEAHLRRTIESFRRPTE